MKTWKHGFLLFTLLCTTLLMQAQTLDEVIDKHLAAMGGKDKLKALNTMITEGTISVQGQKIPVKVYQVHNKAQRVEISFNGMTGYIISTVDSGWTFLPFQGQTKAEATPPAVVKESADFLDIQSNLMDYKTKGHTVELLGKDDVDGTECFKIKVVTKSGAEETIFIDPSNYYIIKTVTKTKASGQEQEQTQMLSAYKKTDDGYVFPFATTGFGPGELTITKIEINKPIDAAQFRPAN
jgi:hypothetical protein